MRKLVTHFTQSPMKEKALMGIGIQRELIEKDASSTTPSNGSSAAVVDLTNGA